MKICAKCKIDKEETEFNRNRSKGSSLQSYCKACHRQVSRLRLRDNPARQQALQKATERRLNINKAYVLAHLLCNPCVDCGETNPVVLEHDHVRGQKLSHVTRLMYQKKPLRVLFCEIAKCEVRCANCHRKKTSKANGSYRQGSTSNPFMAEALDHWNSKKTKELVGAQGLEPRTSCV